MTPARLRQELQATVRLSHRFKAEGRREDGTVIGKMPLKEKLSGQES